MKKAAILSAWFLFSGVTWAQDYPSRIYEAYLGKDMNNWKAIMDEIEAELNTGHDNRVGLLHLLIEAEYGYTAYCISTKRRKEARINLEKGMKYLDQALAFENDNSQIQSLLGAFFGYKLFLEPFRAIKHKRRSENANQTAMKLNPDEPQAWMEKANIAYYTPAILGGSKKEAAELYHQAVRLYESSPGLTHQNWLYLNCLTGLGLAYEHNGQIRKAEEVYKKLLELEPDFHWVRDDLYPALIKKHSLN